MHCVPLYIVTLWDLAKLRLVSKCKFWGVVFVIMTLHKELIWIRIYEDHLGGKWIKQKEFLFRLLLGHVNETRSQAAGKGNSDLETGLILLHYISWYFQLCTQCRNCLFLCFTFVYIANWNCIHSSMCGIHIPSIHVPMCIHNWNNSIALGMRTFLELFQKDS